MKIQPETEEMAFMSEHVETPKRKRPWRLILRTSHFVICCALFIMLPFFLWWMDRLAIGVELWAHMNWKTVAANALPACALGIFLGAVSGRFIGSAVIVSGMSCILYIASKIKFQTLGQPVVFQDIYFLKTLDVSSLKLFASYLSGVSTSMLVFLSLLMPVLLMALFFLEGKVSSLTGKIRAFIALPSLLALFLIIAPAWPVNAIYTKSLMHLDVEYEPMVAVFRGGLFSNILYQHVKTSGVDLSVNEKALVDEFERLKRAGLWPSRQPDDEPGIHAHVQPDIIVVLSESFMDPYVIAGMDSRPDIIPNFRRIAKNFRGGDMQVPTYGGGTVRTEFEVLTGMPLKAFPDVVFPYPDLPMKHLPGLASILAARGYQTTALHANNWRFWNRNVAYQAMRFSDLTPFSAFEKHGQKDGRYHSDESMTDLLLERLQHVDAGPIFSFVISMQGHGPYTGIKDSMRNPELYDSFVLPPLSQGADETLRTYLYHIHAADRQLGRLVDALEKRGRPYRLLFFGDHLPALPQVWSELGFSNGQNADKQKVPWLIAGGGSESDDHIEYSWQLPATVLAGTGLLEPNGYLAFSSAISRATCCAADEVRALPGNTALQAAAHANITGLWKRHAQE